MKKFKLLIPAMSIASVAAITTPLLTACDPYVHYDLSFEKYVESSQKTYETKYEPLAETHFMTQSSMAQSYFNAVKADPYIFADDIMNVISNQYKTVYQYQKFTVSNTQLVKNLMINSRCSSILNFSFSVDQSTSDYHEVINIYLKNMPYILQDKSEVSTDVTTVTPYLSWVDDLSKRNEAYAMLLVADTSIQLSYKKYTIKDKVETLRTDINVETKSLDDLLTLLQQTSSMEIFSWLKTPIASHYYQKVSIRQ